MPYPLQIFFHKFPSRKNQKRLGQAGQEDGAERAGSEVAQDPGAVSDEDGTESDQEGVEEGFSEADEDAVWKVWTLSILSLFFSCKQLPGYASDHAA